MTHSRGLIFIVTNLLLDKQMLSYQSIVYFRIRKLNKNDESGHMQMRTNSDKVEKGCTK